MDANLFSVSSLLLTFILILSVSADEIFISTNAINSDANNIPGIAEDDNHIIKITDANYSENVWNHSLLFLLFYTDWCHYSQEFLPVFSQVAVLAHQKLRNLQLAPDADYHMKNMSIAFGIVDGDTETDLMKRFHVSKYPTLKLVAWGRKNRHEYRGGRSVKGVLSYVMGYVKENVIKIHEKDIRLLHEEISDINSKPILVLFSKDDPSENVFYKESYLKYASTLKDDCDFYYVTLNRSNHEIINPETFNDSLYFHPHIHTYIEPNSTFDGDLYGDRKYVRRWINHKCDPYVTEITFENAEELTERGVPLLILFIDPEDDGVQTILSDYIHTVISEIYSEDSDIDINVGAHYANGKKFTYALNRVGKDPDADLPILVLDNFVHIFTFNGNISDIFKMNGTLKKFVADYNSGKLHEDYHSNFIDNIIKDAKDGDADNDEAHDEEAKEVIYDIGKKVMDAINSKVQDMMNKTDTKYPFIETSGDETDAHLFDENLDTNEDEIKSDAADAIEGKVLSNDNSYQDDDLDTLNSPPESVFIQLQPSVKRYTLLRDEL